MPAMDDDVRYDANLAPDPDWWLGLDEWERISHALDGHGVAPDSHPATPNPRLHAVIHTVVETQLAQGEPPEARRTLARLQLAGCTRHEALHAIGSVVSETVIDVMQEQRPYNAKAYSEALAGLVPEDWRFGDRDGRGGGE